MGYFFTLMYIFILFVRPQEFLGPIKGLPLLDYTTAACVCMVFLEGEFRAEKFRRSPLNVLMLLFWVYLSLTWVPNGWAGGVVVVFQRLAKVVVLYYLIMLTVTTRRRLKGLLWTLAFMGCFLAAQAIVQFYTGVGLVGGEALRRGQVLQARGIGIFADPNDLALYMVSIVPFLLPAFHKRVMSATSITGVMFLIPLLTGIVFTRSRGGLLGLATVAWFYLRRRVGIVFSVVGLLLLFSLLMAIPRMEKINPKQGSARTRLEHWTYGLGLLRSHPIFGVGVGGFTENYPTTAHNSFILVLAEGGLIGGTLWIALIYATLRHINLLRKIETPPPWLEPFTNALEAAFMGWMVCAFFLSHTYKFMGFILMGIAAAAMNVLASEGIDVRLPWKLRHTFASVVLCAAGVVFMHLMVTLLWRL